MIDMIKVFALRTMFAVRRTRSHLVKGYFECTTLPHSHVHPVSFLTDDTTLNVLAMRCELPPGPMRGSCVRFRSAATTMWSAHNLQFLWVNQTKTSRTELQPGLSRLQCPR
jgi:hypothetical protein